MVTTYSITNTGCDSLEYDSEAIKNIIELQYRLRTETIDKADIIIYFGCSYSENMEERFIKNIKEILNNYKNKLIIISGCYLRKYVKHSNVVFVRKENVCEILEKHLRKGKRSSSHYIAQKNKKSPIIAISEGCYSNCTYCSVKLVRGTHVSRPVDAILSDIEDALLNHDTVRFVGQDVSAYGHDCSLTLGKLLLSVFKRFGALKIELGTLNPRWLINANTEDLDLLAHQNVVGNIHLPLQSASNDMLNLMNRGYTYEEFKSLLSQLSDLGIKKFSTDLIAGFPGETSGDHERSLSFLREYKLEFAQIFMYEPRPGTIAADKVQLPRETRLERTLELIAEYVASYMKHQGIIKRTNCAENIAPFNSNLILEEER